jgi:hypothetical protein
LAPKPLAIQSANNATSVTDSSTRYTVSSHSTRNSRRRPRITGESAAATRTQMGTVMMTSHVATMTVGAAISCRTQRGGSIRAPGM